MHFNLMWNFFYIKDLASAVVLCLRVSLHYNVSPELVDLELADPEFANLGLERLHLFVTSG